MDGSQSGDVRASLLTLDERAAPSEVIRSIDEVTTVHKKTDFSPRSNLLIPDVD